MILLGITGAISHGKSSLAEALRQTEPKSVHLESFYVIAEVADALHKRLVKIPDRDDLEAINTWLRALPQIVNDKVGRAVDFKQIEFTREDVNSNPILYEKLFQHLDNLRADPKLTKGKITDGNKPAYRPILQWLGGYMVEKFGSSVWWDELIRRAELAFKEGEQLVVLGGVRYPSDAEIVRVAGGKIIHIIRPGLEEPDTVDPTERERQKIKADITLVNNGRLADLRTTAERLLADIRGKRLASFYRAKADK